MKQLIFVITISISLSFAVVSCDVNNTSPENGTEQSQPEYSPPETWSTAYLASWHHQSEALADSLHQMPTTAIDWQAFTHLSYSGLTIGADGSIIPIKSYQALENIESQIDEIVVAAHDEGVPVLLSIGGWASRENFVEVMQNGNQNKLISNLIEMMEMHNLDGIDLNIEPLEDEDAEYYEQFVDELHTALQEIKPSLPDKPILTAATSWQSEMFGRIYANFDQINVMTYNYSNAWEGWVTWHNSPVYSAEYTFPNEERLLPSVERDLKRFLNAGIPEEKIGIGIDFYGYVWSIGVNAPMQSWSQPPEVQADVPYHAIMDSLFSPDYYVWDDEVKAAYLSIDKADSLDDKFVSYEDEKAVQAKFEYIRERGLGGAIIWELSGGYRAGQPVGERNRLLQAVKEALQK